MGRKIYSKSIKELCEEFAGHLAHNETFIPRRAVDWFTIHHPKINPASVTAHLIRLTTNNPTRVHYKATQDDDIFFKLRSGELRKYNPASDPPPIYHHTTPKHAKRSKTRSFPARTDQRIDDLIQGFHDYLSFFSENLKFSGPSVYFHNKVLEKIRQATSYSSLFDDETFF
jgi:hypothetical protein